MSAAAAVAGSGVGAAAGAEAGVESGVQAESGVQVRRRGPGAWS